MQNSLLRSWPSQTLTAIDDQGKKLISVARPSDKISIETPASPDVLLLIKAINFEANPLNDENNTKTPAPPSTSLLLNGSDLNETPKNQTIIANNLASDFEPESEPSVYE